MDSDIDQGDDLAYLQPGFDLNALTVPRLRSILVNHDVPYPASAKKTQLIAILENEVMPKARKILRERDRVRRTSKGITNMPSQNGDQEQDDNRLSVPPPATPSTSSVRRGRSRPSTRASTATSVSDADQLLPPPSTSRRRTTRAKHPRASDTEETGEDTVPSIEAQTPVRKSRRSEAQTAASQRADTGYTDREPRLTRESSVFTDDNPFQSGSSPLGEVTPKPRTVSSGRKSSRQSADIVLREERRRRKTSEPRIHVKQEDGIEVPKRSTFDVPIKRLSTIKTEEDEILPGEEFAPDQQEELEGEMGTDGYEQAVVRQQQHGSGSIASWIVIFTLLGAFAAWWRQEKVEIGYCGVGKPRWSLVDTNVPAWADVVEPKCETCPQHAICYPNFETRCEPDFVLKPHPLSLGGLVPIPPSCEPDGEKVRRVKVVADKAVEELRERRAKYECGEPQQEDGQEVASPDMSVTELKDRVNRLRRKGMSDEEFEELWKGALGEISGREEVESITQGPPSATVQYFSSSSLAKLSFSCSIRRHLRLSLLAYRLPLLLLTCALAGVGYARSRVIARRSEAARVPSLVGMTLDRLATQAALHARGEAKEPWISVGQLRDDVLREEFNQSRRERLWKRVRAVVEGNANVRASVREGRGGDVSRVWEWIGGLAGLEWDGVSSPAISRRESGRVRFLDTPDHGPDAGHVAHRADLGDRGVRKWDEGRAIY